MVIPPRLRFIYREGFPAPFIIYPTGNIPVKEYLKEVSALSSHMETI